MSKPPKTRTGGKAEKLSGAAPTVAVIGGGLAGINTAFQLIKAGFAVTIFEADSILGGNTSSVDVKGTEHDVYPHMFCDWYVNFWHMFENELGLSRDRFFEARPSVKMRQKGSPDYAELFNPTSLAACIHNLRSGAMKPAEMLLLGFSELDLLSFPFERSGLNQLQQLDVNGFIYSRGYSTEPIAKMENYILSLIWSINSEQTAAATYQNFLRHAWQFPNHAPFAWMLKGSLSKELIAPAEARLRELGCAIETDMTVSCLRIENDKPVLTVAGTDGSTTVSERPFDYAVCAVPPPALAALALAKGGNPSCRSMADCEPSLANLQRLDTVAIPVVDLYLKKKLPDFPKESIGLAGSRYGLTALDISQLWTDSDFGGKTALVLAASDGAAIPSDNLHKQGWLVLKELAEFYPEIHPGTHWGDPVADVDWDKSHVRDNARHKLLLNDVGSWAWRPSTCYPSLPRIAFAGDLCLNEVDMATVEGAVISGISAACAIQLADKKFNGKLRGKAIQALPHTVYGEAAFRAAKLWFLPAAYVALGFAAYDQWRDHEGNESSLKQGNHYPMIDYLALVPLQYTIDWWKGAYWLVRSLVDKDAPELDDVPDSDDMDLLGIGRRGPHGVGPDEMSDEPGQPDDIQIGLGTAVLMLLGECADYAIDHLGKHPQARGEGLGSNLAGMAQAFIGGLGTDQHKRRWRAKQ